MNEDSNNFIFNKIIALKDYKSLYTDGAGKKAVTVLDFLAYFGKCTTET